MSQNDNKNDRDRPRLVTRVGRRLSFMNTIALVLVIVGLIALLAKNH